MSKLSKTIGQVQFAVFEKFTSAYLFEITQKLSCDINLLIIYMKKGTESKRTQDEFL